MWMLKWKEHVSNGGVLRKIGTISNLLSEIAEISETYEESGPGGIKIHRT